jgi:hypothetical protein
MIRPCITDDTLPSTMTDARLTTCSIWKSARRKIRARLTMRRCKDASRCDPVRASRHFSSC